MLSMSRGDSPRGGMLDDVKIIGYITLNLSYHTDGSYKDVLLKNSTYLSTRMGSCKLLSSGSIHRLKCVNSL